LGLISAAVNSVLEGSALLAFGSDTAGSVRIPACMTGTVGLQLTASANAEERLLAIALAVERVSAPRRPARNAALLAS
jgi:aspartyl-tRNA(Asn)/glutamyl-tRNA(Gln) amidotransferase subunit A